MRCGAPGSGERKTEGSEHMERADRFAGVGSDAVQARTGRTWEEWFAVLDAAGATQMPHPEIARYLAEQGVSDWWCQMVTVGYEQARGLRAVHQKADGFAVSASKTVGVPVMRLYEAWADAGERGHWLPDAAMTVRRATPGKSLRIAWHDGSGVDVNLAGKGEAKSQVALQHSKLSDAEAVARWKRYWGEALARLKAYLEE